MADYGVEIVILKYHMSCKTVFLVSFLDNPTSRDTLWFLGDNFAATSFRNHFKKVMGPGGQMQYIKKHYKYTTLTFVNSRFASSNTNMLARLQNTLVTRFNQKKNEILPRYVLVVLDDDLITFLDFKREGAATLLGNWVQWLAQQFDGIVAERKNQLPVKCQNVDTFFYWVTAPVHSLFSKERNNLRLKFNLSLESVIRTQTNMRVIRLKDWNTRDTELVANDKFTETGMTAYWNAIDSAFCFNEKCREVFLAKKITQRETHEDLKEIKSADLCPTRSSSTAKHEDVDLDPMWRFFRDHSSARPRFNDNRARFVEDHSSHYVGYQMDTREDLRHKRRAQFGRHYDRFLLPRLKSRFQ